MSPEKQDLYITVSIYEFYDYVFYIWVNLSLMILTSVIVSGCLYFLAKLIHRKIENNDF